MTDLELMAIILYVLSFVGLGWSLIDQRRRRNKAKR